MDRRFTIDSHTAEHPTAAPTATINDLMATFVAELEAGGIPDPTGQALTLGIVWADLCRLAGEEPPPAIAALLDDAIAA